VTRDIAAVLRDLHARGAAAWPDLAVDPDTFARWVRERARADAEPAEALAALHAEPLYLACACASGNRTAATAFQKTYAGVLDRALARVSGPSALKDDVKQRVLVLLLVGPPDRPPKIGEYGGRGDFERWLKTVVTREAFAVLDRGKREVAVDDDGLAALALPDGDPEIEHLKHLYGAAFREAIRAALAQLPRATIAELRQYYVEKLGVEAIGAMQKVAPSTVSRRLAKARAELAALTRAALAERLQASAGEVESILRLIESRLDLSRGALE
jgi:RNA polymerase sigma-70 factor (ECF subfamily)